MTGMLLQVQFGMDSTPTHPKFTNIRLKKKDPYPFQRDRLYLMNLTPIRKVVHRVVYQCLCCILLRAVDKSCYHGNSVCCQVECIKVLATQPDSLKSFKKALLADFLSATAGSRNHSGTAAKIFLISNFFIFLKKFFFTYLLF